MHIKLSGNFLYLNISENKDTLDTILTKHVVSKAQHFFRKFNVIQF